MDLLIQAKCCFDFLLFQILILAIFYLQYMLWMLPLTIWPVQNMSKLHPQQFFGITLYWVV